MHYISREHFDELRERHPDYIAKCLITHSHDGKTARAGQDYMAYESVLIGEHISETKLVFEHIDFEIV